MESRHPHHGAVQAFIKCSRAGRVILDLLRKLKLSLWELCKNINVLQRLHCAADVTGALTNFQDGVRDSYVRPVEKIQSS